jgi:hypothetical protein
MNGVDWLWLSCIGSFAAAICIGAVLAAFWFADRADEQAEERNLADRIVSHGDQWPVIGNDR